MEDKVNIIAVEFKDCAWAYRVLNAKDICQSLPLEAVPAVPCANCSKPKALLMHPSYGQPSYWPAQHLPGLRRQSRHSFPR
jgi:hypothetical protein